MDLTGKTATPNASRYLQQLCKHWGHRFETRFDERQGHVDFGDGSSVDLTAAPDALAFVVHGPAESMDELKHVVEEHVDRFAHREGTLIYEWAD